LSRTILFVDDAIEDLRELERFILARWSAPAWASAYEEIRAAIRLIAERPRAGSLCEELEALGTSNIRQVLAGPNRVLYEILDDGTLHIYAICNQKRELGTLLQRRFLRQQP
jgi:toxin ParE1/3/4